MKRLLLALTAVLLAMPVIAATGRATFPRQGTVQPAPIAGGTNAPVEWNGTGSCSSVAAASALVDTTDWIQIGFSSAATDTGNRLPYDHYPKQFTLSLKLSRRFASSDSCYIHNAHFEMADSSNAVVPFWNADSSNWFIKSGNYNRPDYGIWTYEIDSVKTRGMDFNLKITRPGFFRLIYATSNQDTIDYIWRLRAMP